MVMYRNSQKISFVRWINKRSRASVLAFQFSEKDLDYLRVLWKSPSANAGDWYVKLSLDQAYGRTKIVSNEEFHRQYRQPFQSSASVIANDDDWDVSYE
jgi:hypothetical protein